MLNLGISMALVHGEPPMKGIKGIKAQGSILFISFIGGSFND
jgi:hypothetical protein